MRGNGRIERKRGSQVPLVAREARAPAGHVRRPDLQDGRLLAGGQEWDAVVDAGGVYPARELVRRLIGGEDDGVGSGDDAVEIFPPGDRARDRSRADLGVEVPEPCRGADRLGAPNVG
jgi:hypothetical protein